QKEIAGVMELSEGRISQLHSQALLKLKAGMQDK
ncbi:MAG: FliA/WhiG family RNA polymerase sigma factor, partial [Desulfohalobiaceae bacterium]|nr:FliA/WhiG family RNA polymerase sigma factor [Desulfohalobiaceae bacterium]